MQADSEKLLFIDVKMAARFMLEFHYDVKDVQKVPECLPKTFLCAFVCSRNDGFVITKRIFFPI